MSCGVADILEQVLNRYAAKRENGYMERIKDAGL